MGVVVNCGMCELAAALELHVVMICKIPINSVNNQNRVYSYPTCDNILR
jgi:hypothetical protein